MESALAMYGLISIIGEPSKAPSPFTVKTRPLYYFLVVKRKAFSRQASTHRPHNVQSVEFPMSSSLVIPIPQASRHAWHFLHLFSSRRMFTMFTLLKAPAIAPIGHK